MQTIAHGQDRTSYSGNMISNVHDLNRNTRGENVVGNQSKPGKWRVMEQTDDSISLGSRSLIGVLQDTKWDITANELCDPKVLEFVKRAFFEKLKTNFSAVARRLFFAINYGVSPHEAVFSLQDGLWYLSDLAYRPIHTIDIQSIKRGVDGWIECTQDFYDDDGKNKTVKYGQPGSGKPVLFWPTFGDSGSILGEGLYRPLYSIYEDKMLARRIKGPAIQKATLGTPAVYLKEGVNPESNTEANDQHPTQAEYEETLATLGSLMAHEQGALGVPSWVEKMETVFSDPGAVDSLIRTIDNCDIKILTFFAAQYAARGIITGHGTNAANENDADVQISHKKYFIDWLCGSMQVLVDYLVDLNFGPQAFYPSFVGHYDKDITPEQLINIIATAKNNDMLYIDDGIRRKVRGVLKLEAESVDALEQVEKDKGIDEHEEIEAIVDNDETENKDADNSINMSIHKINESISRRRYRFGGIVRNFAEGVRQAPKLGGQEQNSGPNGRALGNYERLVDWKTLKFSFDNNTKSLEAALMSARELFAKYLVLESSEQSNTVDELSENLQSIKIPAKVKKEAEKLIRTELEYIAQVAERSASNEFDKQKDSLSFAASNDGDFPYLKNELKREVFEAEADARSQIVSASFQIVAPSMQETIDLLKRASGELSAAQASSTATIATSNVINQAREARVKDIQQTTGNGIKNVWYSAVLDASTCSECERADELHGEASGNPIKMDSPEMTEFYPPNQYCLGGNRCRCIYIYEWN